MVHSSKKVNGAHLRHSLFEDVVRSISRAVVFLIKYPRSSLVQAFQLFILGVLQDLRYVPQDAVHLQRKQKM